MEKKFGRKIYKTYYNSPLGKILLAADDKGLIGLWFENQKYYAGILNGDIVDKEIDVLSKTKLWMNIYFSGKEPDFIPEIHMIGTDFRKAVWKILLTIPYGHTLTYGEIAEKLKDENKSLRMSAQAVGGAVGHNPIALIIPCHRVVDADGKLTGYAGGIEKKERLLALERGTII